MRSAVDLSVLNEMTLAHGELLIHRARELSPGRPEEWDSSALYQ
jgi:hypothetical protein